VSAPESDFRSYPNNRCPMPASNLRNASTIFAAASRRGARGHRRVARLGPRHRQNRRELSGEPAMTRLCADRGNACTMLHQIRLKRLRNESHESHPHRSQSKADGRRTVHPRLAYRLLKASGIVVFDEQRNPDPPAANRELFRPASIRSGRQFR
jgi:hypothetical protein